MPVPKICPKEDCEWSTYILLASSMFAPAVCVTCCHLSTHSDNYRKKEEEDDSQR